MMNLSGEMIEVYLKREYGKYNLHQVEGALIEIKDIQKKFLKFEFKNKSNMTALEFFEIQRKLKDSLKILTARKKEILKKRSKKFAAENNF